MTTTTEIFLLAKTRRTTTVDGEAKAKEAQQTVNLTQDYSGGHRQCLA